MCGLHPLLSQQMPTEDVHPYGDLYDRVASCTRMTEKDAMYGGPTGEGWEDQCTHRKTTIVNDNGKPTV